MLVVADKVENVGMTAAANELAMLRYQNKQLREKNARLQSDNTTMLALGWAPDADVPRGIAFDEKNDSIPDGPGRPGPGDTA